MTLLRRPIALFGLFCIALLLSISDFAPARAVTPTLQLVAPAGAQAALDPFTVEVRIAQAANLGAWEFDLAYDPALVTITGITVNDFFARSAGCDPATARCAVVLGPIDENGLFSAGAVSYGQASGANGDGLIATLQLQPKGVAGTTTLHVTNALLTDTAANPIAPATVDVTLDLSAASFGATHTIYLPVVTR
ncbi:MAG TPA: cohesin domain-containing protein [Caldilineaceae bacterium]|nr:cohesin domain-containing protein [Caldilineaceae bacterium]